MKIHAIVSAAALVAGMTFAGAASAQTYMMDGVAIPTDRVQEFSDKCAALQASANASLTSDQDANDTNQTNTADSGSDDDADETETGSVSQNSGVDTENPDPAAMENWDEALTTLSAEDCAAAGFPVVNQ